MALTLEEIQKKEASAWKEYWKNKKHSKQLHSTHTFLLGLSLVQECTHLSKGPRVAANKYAHNFRLHCL